MEELIKLLFAKSILSGENKYSSEEIESKWIGTSPAEIQEIERIEKMLKVEFPDDYKELLLLTNGFKTSNDAVEPSFLPISEVDYLKKIDPFVIECYEDTLKELDNSILVAGKYEEQQFLLIPPSDKNKKWRYWKFANWMAGEYEFADLRSYLKNVVESLTLRKE